MSDLILRGQPVCSFEFLDLPSWNTVINKHFRKRANDTRVMREEGCRLAQEFKKSLPRHLRKEFAVNRALVVVKVFTPGERIRDIYNVNIKAVCDGFTDAGLWQDDEWATVPVTVLMWAGHEETKILVSTPGRRKRRAVTRTVIEIHELRRVLINAQEQILPVGGRV